MTQPLSEQFVLKIETENPHIARTWVETFKNDNCSSKEKEKDNSEGVKEGSKVVMASFYPSVDTFESDQSLPCEIIFIVDRYMPFTNI